jgi:hypothetical protein
MPLYGADFLYLTKNVRTHPLTYVPVIRYGDSKKDVRWQVMKEHLDLGLVFADSSSTGKMRNSYLIVLFRLGNVIKFFSKKWWAKAIYLLPWTFAMILFGLVVIAKDSRRFRVKLALHLLMFVDVDDTDGVRYLNAQGAVANNLMRLKPITLTRAMAMIIGFMYAFVELD